MNAYINQAYAAVGRRKAPARPAIAPKSTGFAAIVRAAIETLTAWQERAYGRSALHKLDDRLLRDIGISRADAVHEADKPFWRG